MEQDKKLILEICKKNGVSQEEGAEGKNLVAPETVAKLLADPPVLDYSQQEIQKAIDEQHYELTEEDINAIKTE